MEEENEKSAEAFGAEGSQAPVAIEMEKKTERNGHQHHEGAVKTVKLKFSDTPKQQHFVIVWFKQLYIMLKTDAILTV